jgi:PKD repeat protein
MSYTILMRGMGRAAVILMVMLAAMAGGAAAAQYDSARAADIMGEGSAAFKEALSGDEQKLSTDLVLILRGEYVSGPDGIEIGGLTDAAYTRSIPSSSVMTDESGKTKVYVYVQVVPPAPTAAIDPYAVEVTDRDEEAHLAVAWVETDRLDDLAAQPEVGSVEIVYPPVVYSIAAPRVGSVECEADAILKTEQLREKTGYAGAGMKVGILSDSADQWQEAAAKGDLPVGVHILADYNGDDEGTAMLEIVHDLAPEAELYFHTAYPNSVTFTTGITALADAGCQVICDDIGWLTEPFFEDGYVASHVRNLLKTRDLIYVSAGGNDAGGIHYQGAFQNDGYGWHSFAGGRNLLFTQINPGSGGQSNSFMIILQWDDVWGKSSNDYDLYLVGEDGNGYYEIMNSSKVQDGDDKPMEIIEGTYSGSTVSQVYLAVEAENGAAPRNLEIFIFSGGKFNDPVASDEDTIFGHPAVPDVVCVGAIDASDPGNDTIEPFSSRGRVTITNPAPEVRDKPDICGIDGVRVTGAGGFPSTFFGTSAAAPTIAGVTALIWGLDPKQSADEIKDALYAGAVDLGESGWDPVFGYGRADAMAVAVQPELSANFNASPLSGPAPLSVRFTDLSTGPVTAWQWDFGDGAASAEQNPAHNYTAEGLYTVSLMVSDGQGNSDTLVMTDYINVAPAHVENITADFTADVTSGPAPLTVQFTDLSTGPVKAWHWDFGDGATSSKQHPEHIYLQAGTYTVSLTATGDLQIDTLTREDYISVEPAGEVDANLTFVPSGATLQPGTETDFALIMDAAGAGISGYTITLSLEDPEIGEIIAVSFPAWAGLKSNGTLPADAVWLRAVDLEGKAGTENITLCTVTVRGDTEGTTTLSILDNATIEDREGGIYKLATVPATLTVGAAAVLPFPKPDGTTYPAPTDPDGDGLYEDVDGNGRIGFNDVVVYYTNLQFVEDEQPLEAFDYDGNGRIGFNDVIVLYGMVP